MRVRRGDALDGDVEPGPRLKHRQPDRPLAADETIGERADVGEVRRDLRREHRAFLDVDDVVRKPFAVAEPQTLLDALRRQHGAAAACRGDADRLRHIRLETALQERRDDEIALQIAVRGKRQHLQCAAAATSEMAARRRDPVRARLDNLDGPRPLTPLVRLSLDRDPLARKRERHIERTRCGRDDAVAAMPDRLDGDGLTHAARRPGIRGCRSRLRSGRG